MILEISKWIYMAIALFFVINIHYQPEQIRKAINLCIVMLAVVLAVLTEVLQKL